MENTTTNIKQTPDTTFKTDDINLAAFIKTRGGIVLDIGILSNSAFMKRYYFEFENIPFCEELKLIYMNGKGDEVSAREFTEAKEMFVKKVKSLSLGFR